MCTVWCHEISQVMCLSQECVLDLLPNVQMERIYKVQRFAEMGYGEDRLTLSTMVPRHTAQNHTKIMAHAGPWGGRKGFPIARYRPA